MRIGMAFGRMPIAQPAPIAYIARNFQQPLTGKARVARQFIYHMAGLNKAYGTKKVLENIHLSFYPDAKIGILGPNGAGKSTVLKIMAGMDKEYTGEAWLAEGATVGYLAQEPQLDPAKTVFENVMEGVAKKTAIIDRYNELMMNYSDETADESAKLQDDMDRLNLWDLEQQVEMAMEALGCPPKDAEVTKLSGGERRRVALCQLLLRAARPAAARRADQPSRRRDHGVAGKASAPISGRGDDHHPRPLLPRQCHRLDPRARSRPRHSLRGQLHRLSRGQGQAHAPGRPRGRRPLQGADPRARMDRVQPEGPAGQVQGAHQGL